jgi:hypothetical protein
MSDPTYTVRLCKFLAVSAGLTLMTACSSSPSSTGPISVPLAYHSTSSSGNVIMTRAKVYVEPVTDGRTADMTMSADPATTMPVAVPAGVVIGHNVQGSSPVPVYDTGASPMVFLHDAMVDQLGKCGVTVVPTPDQADRIVRIRLTGFDVTEAGTYKSSISAMFNVADKSNAIIYGRPDTGEDSHWGRSRDASEYQDNLTAATNNLVQTILSDEVFKKSLLVAQ